METITVAQIYGDRPVVDVAPAAQWHRPRPESLWSNYDAETDSLILYLTGKPVRGVHVWFGEGVNVIVDPATHDVVGLYIEAWERQFLPSHPDIQQMWGDIKPTTLSTGWSHLLRMLALWLFILFQPQDNDVSAMQVM